MTGKRSAGRLVAIVVGGILVAMVSLTGMAVCGLGTCGAVGMRDGCDHDATLAALKVDRVERTDAGVRIRLIGRRLPGLSDAYLRAGSIATASASPDTTVVVEPGSDAVVLEVAPVGPDETHELSAHLTFPCRRAELDCSHPGTGDHHTLWIRWTLETDERGAPKVTTLDSGAGYDPGDL